MSNKYYKKEIINYKKYICMSNRFYKISMINKYYKKEMIN